MLLNRVDTCLVWLICTLQGVNPVVKKRPFSLREHWLMQGSKYKDDYHVSYPPLSFFVRFVCAQAKTRNDPSLTFNLFTTPGHTRVEKAPKYIPKTAVSVRKTEVTSTTSASQSSSAARKDEPDKQCPIHNPTKHIAKDCKATLKCKECESVKHTSAVHPGLAPWSLGVLTAENEQGKEPEVTSMCMEVCGGAPKTRTCS